MATDHGLNRDGDAIVMTLWDASEIASGSIREVGCSARHPGKMSNCIVGNPMGSIGPIQSTGLEDDFRGAIMTTQPTPTGAWRITMLLFLFILVNFADKIVVGLAGAPIMTA